MKKILLVLVLFVSINTIAQQKNYIDQNYIEVTGNSELEVSPNELFLKIILSENDFKNKVTVEEMEKKMLKKLSEIGVDISKNLSIVDMASSFKNYWIKSSEIKTVKEYKLLVNTASLAGKVFQELEALNISNISIEKVDHSDIEKLKNEVKIKAIKSAQEKATALTESIGQSCGKAIYIQELNNNVYRALEGRVAGIAVKSQVMMDAPMPEIEFEKIKLEYSILVRFAL